MTREKKKFADLKAFRESIVDSQRNDPSAAPARIYDQVDVSCQTIRGRPCYTLRPRDRSATTRHVMYLHGGAYVHQIKDDHWSFFVQLVNRTGCSVTVPVYPLAPESTCEETVEMVKAVYDDVLAGTAPEDRIVMGDSAGGALSLVIAESLEEAGEPQPKELVLLSPWLDVTMSDPAIQDVEHLDPVLAVPGLREAGRIYRDERDPYDPTVSPLFGPLSALHRVSVFIGTHDVLLPDARYLRKRAEIAGVPLEYYEYKRMFHVWPLADIPEGRQALEQIADIIMRDR